MPAPTYSQTTAIHRRHGAFAVHPLAQLATSFSVGILAGLYLVVPLAVLVSLAALATVLAGILILTPNGKVRNKARARRNASTIVVTLAMLALGATFESIERTKVPANQLRSLLAQGAVAVGEPVELTGVLERDPEVAPQRIYLQMRLEGIRSRLLEANPPARASSVERNASGVVMLLASIQTNSNKQYDQLDLRYGARIRVMTVLQRSDSLRNPGVSSFTEYLDRKGYDATGFVKSPLLVERMENTRVLLPLRWLFAWRRQLQTEIDSRFSRDTAGVLDAALLGNRYNLSQPTSERFREGGTFHVLVISGLHITFLGGLVFLIARRFTSNTVLQFLLSTTVLWAYALAVGAESSVVRAALMFTIVLCAPLVSRHASSVNALGGTALVLLAWRPSDLLDPSFQLTFISVLAIVIFAWPLMEKLSAIGAWHPTRETPYPPSVAPWLRSLCESLFWSERKAGRELERASHSYKLFKAPVAAKLERWHLQRPFRYAFGAILVSAVVQLALLPLLVVYFHRLSFASFLLNIGVSLLMAAVAIVAAVALLLAQISSTVATPFISITNFLNWVMVHSVDPFAKVGAASIRLPEYTGWASAVYALYYLPLSRLVLSLSRWKPLEPVWPAMNYARRVRNSLGVLLAQLFLVALILAHPFSAGLSSGKLRVDFLDVGQGDSALITFPDNTTLLIDGGGRPGPFEKEVDSSEDESFEQETRSIGESVVSEYLWWRGLDHIDYILATHADADHIDGLNDVARNFHVRAALIARTPGKDVEYSKFAQTLADRKIPVQLIGAGDVLRVGPATASVLWPAPEDDPNAPSRNNDSVVLHLQLGVRSLLLTGDIEMAGEKGMLRAADDLRVDVVKVAHHGSKTSSTPSFIAAAQPRLAIISVGQTSIFGHPNSDVVERWKQSGAQVLTTGKSGTITITTDGRELELDTFVKK